MKGKLIVLYGANNLGKSTQIELLEKSLKDRGIKVKRIKYPIYDLEPTGPTINAVLRKGKKMSEDKLQQMYVQNRRDYEPTLKKILKSGTWVIAEDYIGTGIAWGMVRGLDLEEMEEWNKLLYPADFSLIIHGKQFSSGKEVGHRNENDVALWKKAQDNHLFLAKRYGWKKVLANQPINKVQQDILDAIDVV